VTNQKQIGYVFIVSAVALAFVFFLPVVLKRLFFSPSRIVATEKNGQFFYSLKAKKSSQPRVTVTPTSHEFGLIVPKLNINAPVKEKIDPDNKKGYFYALKSALAHYRGTGLPGEGKNIVIFGHSSDMPGANSKYPDVFLNLDKLDAGDVIHVYYKNQLYKYKVTKSQKISADDFSVLKNTKEKEELTLITCWPPGTDVKRFMVRANRI